MLGREVGGHGVSVGGSAPSRASGDGAGCVAAPRARCRNVLGVPSARAPTQLVEEAYRAWNAGGPPAFVEFTTDDVELHDPPELPDTQTWVGRDVIVARLDDVVASTGGTWADVDEVRPVGDEVLVSLTWKLDRVSTATLAAVYHVVKLEGDRIARVRVFLDADAAVRAASEG